MSLIKTAAIATAALLFAGGAMAQTAKPAKGAKPAAAAPAADAGPVGFFPEIPHPAPPPGAPSMQEALDAYLHRTPPDPNKPPPPPPQPAQRVVPSITSIGPAPPSTSIQFMIPEDIPWKGREGGNQTYNIFGSPTEPGPYLQLMKWWPGAYSNPHMHVNTRNILVISGTWWVCACATQDKTKTYPLQVGTIVHEPAYTYHWDGARNEPAILMLWGNGPSPNISVGEDGLPLIGDPARARTGSAAPAAK